jgi:hypothetical protein
VVFAAATKGEEHVSSAVDWRRRIPSYRTGDENVSTLKQVHHALIRTIECEYFVGRMRYNNKIEVSICSL